MEQPSQTPGCAAVPLAPSMGTPQQALASRRWRRPWTRWCLTADDGVWVIAKTRSEVLPMSLLNLEAAPACALSRYEDQNRSVVCAATHLVSQCLL